MHKGFGDSQVVLFKVTFATLILILFIFLCISMQAQTFRYLMRGEVRKEIQVTW